jgi:hypothetical protein
VSARGRPALTELRVTIPSVILERARRRAMVSGVSLDRWFAEAAEVALISCRHGIDPVRDPFPAPEAGREKE